MNNNLIEVNDLIALKTDDEGKISVIIKDNNEYRFEDILEIENEIEILNQKIENCYDEIKKNKLVTLFAETINFSSIFIILLMYFLSNNLIELNNIFFPMIMFYSVSKCINVKVFETRLKRYKTRIDNNNTLDKLQNKLESKEKQLIDMRTKTNYKNSELNHDCYITDEKYVQYGNYLINNETENKPKLRVRKLNFNYEKSDEEKDG